MCAVLNDVFGIQSRGGCSCAGPYGQVRVCGLSGCGQGVWSHLQSLLGISEELARQYESQVTEDRLVGVAYSEVDCEL